MATNLLMPVQTARPAGAGSPIPLQNDWREESGRQCDLLLPPARSLDYCRSLYGKKAYSVVGPRYLTFTHCFFFALASTASQTFCVSSASRKVGPAGLPVSRPFRKSAT